MLAVPSLVLAAAPALGALGAAQAQPAIIAAAGSASCSAHRSVDRPPAVAIGTPELTGVALGHRLARVAPATAPSCSLSLTLIALGPSLALR